MTALDTSRTNRVTRQDVEDFLYQEAALLDEWRLEEWLDLFTEDCVYEIPAPDAPDTDASRTFSLVYDRRTLLEQRVIRLKKPTAHAEFPHSRTRRLITNVRVLGESGDEIMAGANFAVHRIRNGRDVCYVGRYEYVLRCAQDGFRISHRKVFLDQQVLDPHGKISIIL
ncbi:aromatic-ring-hydroxylating dioxygenase subunit beta [Streptomyces sp. NPDC002143]